MGRSGAVCRRSACGTPVKDAHASRSSASSAGLPSLTRTAAKCPSTTFTRWHCALTAHGAGVTRPASREPRILRVSRSIFSSSSAMNGTTLSVMSSDATPGYPAPEMACSVVAATATTPNRAASGARASAIITVAQLGFALALAPLAARFGVVAVAATTLQAISGAGYPGVASLDITDNVVPFIAEEEEKIERETRRILGSLDAGRVTPAPCAVSAQCHRANVVDGHLAAVRVKLGRPAEPTELREAWASFTGLPQALRLPTAPERPIVVRDEPDRPQPRLDRDAGRGMSVTVGRIGRDAVLGHRFVALSHNTIRGAAGAAVLNAELLLAKGYLEAR